MTIADYIRCYRENIKGKTTSQAIDLLERILFSIEMKDRFSMDDYDRCDALNQVIKELKNEGR